MTTATGVPAPDVVADLREALFSSAPDPAALETRLTEEVGVSADEARALIYQVVLQLNRRLFPPVTQLELIHTEGCNLACTYCFEKDMLGVRRMSPEVLTAGIDLFLDYSGDRTDLRVTHFGGEPTLNFTAIRAATEYVEREAARRGKSVAFDMTTNGVLLTEEMTDYCARHNIMVLLSVDGLEVTHDRFRRDRKGRGTFDRVMRALRLLKQSHGWVGVKMTVMPDNAGRLFEDVTGLYALGVNQFVIGHATGVDWPVERMQTYTDELARVLRWYEETPRDDLRIAEFEQADGAEAYFGCQAGRISITVAVNGEISPCAKVLALDNRNLLAKLGDVRYGLTHLKNRSDLVGCGSLKAACEREGIAADFRGGCFAANYEDTGNLFVPSLRQHQFTVMRRSTCGDCSARGRGPAG